jgi:hypothetical protein
MAKGVRKTLIQRSREKSPSEKAGHAVYGAGKSLVVRDFFGLSAREEQDIERELGARIDVNLQRQG